MADSRRMKLSTLPLHILIGTYISGNLAVPRAIALPSQGTLSHRHCKTPIARLLSSGDERFKAGSKLCAKDQLQPTANQRLKLLCKSGKLVTAASKVLISQLCQSQLAPIQTQSKGKQHILKIRGNLPASRVQRPFGSVLIEDRPTLEWQAVERAVDYQIRVEGHNLSWQHSVKDGTRLKYPESAPALQPGQVYRVTVTAYSQTQALKEVRTSYQVLSMDSIAEVQEAEKLLLALNLSDTEKAVERDRLYLSFRLLDQSIQQLEMAVNQGAERPVKQLLAQRYTEAGYPELGQELLSTHATFFKASFLPK